MKLKKNSLTVKIWIYLILFSVIILVFLWAFQVLFIKGYYELETRSKMGGISNKIEKYYNENDYEELYDLISYDNNLCLEIIKGNSIIYSSEMKKGCIFNPSALSVDYRKDFIYSNKLSQNYTITNPRFNNKTLIYAFKLDDETYAFINTSLEPIDSTITILKNQLIIVTVVVLALSFVIAYFISKNISKPIIKINDKARKLALGIYSVDFTSEDNIEEINELSNTLNYTKNELSKINELRRDLMANVSHDLKTPLTMIKAYAEMARDLNQNRSAKRKDNLNIIIEESDRLNLLVNDILELSKNESNVGNLKYEEFNLTSLIKTIIKRYSIYSQTESYKFIFNVKENIIVNADKQKMEQVIYNLINNAINYTGDDKKVYINIEKYPEFYRVLIKDTGKGIDASEINSIWDKYYKSDKQHKRSVIGTGLGLAIVKSILINHKFNYGVESTKDKGTIFYFDIR